MNRISKNVGIGLFGCLVIVLSSTARISALSGDRTTTIDKTTPFCTNFPSTFSKVNDSISNLQTKLTTAWNQRSQKIASNDAKWDQAIAADQAKWASERKTQFSDLQAKATTDAQKAAVQTYINTMTTAINTRETANAAARSAYRTAVQNLLSSQQSTISAQLTTFSNAVNAAEAAAQSGCTSSPTENNNRMIFVAAMKAARLAYVSDRKGDSGLTSQVKALAATRDSAIKTNDQNFEAVAKTAAGFLKAAFAESGTNVTD